MRGEHPSGRGRTRLCREVAAVLPALIDEPEALEGLGGGAGEQHLRECLRCQAEVARYRRLRRTMRGLSEIGNLTDSGPGSPRATAGAIETLELALDEAIGRRERILKPMRKTALLGGIAAATAAGVGGVFVLATRRRSA
jgi:anti-sigma factor RsiW